MSRVGFGLAPTPLRVVVPSPPLQRGGAPPPKFRPRDTPPHAPGGGRPGGGARGAPRRRGALPRAAPGRRGPRLPAAVRYAHRRPPLDRRGGRGRAGTRGLLPRDCRRPRPAVAGGPLRGRL